MSSARVALMPRARNIICAVVSLLAADPTALRGVPADAREQDSHPVLTVPAGGPFTLAATNGAVVTEKTYRGKWLLVYFGYTYCPDICPTSLNTIAGTLEELGRRAGNVQPLFITIDPKRDTPQILAEYVKAFDPRIVALTGTPMQIAAAARAYGVIYERQDTEDGDYLYNHTSYIYLMDRDGKFITAFAGNDDHAKIARRLSQVMQAKNGAAPAN